MRILILAQRVPYPPNKGEKLRTFHQLEFLQKNGAQISVLAPHESDDELVYFEALRNNYCEQVSTRKLQSKALSLPLGLIKNQSLSVANFYSRSLQVDFDQLISSQPFDAIMCSASSMAEYLFKSSVLKTLPTQPQLIMDFMDVDSDKWAQYARQSNPLMKLIYTREHKLLSQYEGKIAEQFDACFLITDTEVDLFKQSHPQYTNIHAIENGIDSALFFPPNSSRQVSDPAFLFAGVMDYPPNIDAVSWFVDNVWDGIIARWPKATFVIAGMNPTDKINQYANKTGIEVTGFVDDIKPYFDQANIFVAPFRIARGVQNKVLQAFACELPVIATPMGAEGIRCQHGVDILLANSSHEFVSYTQRLIDDLPFYQSISSNALSTIQSYYSWDSILRPLKRLTEGKPPYEEHA
jgi:sugar transferase (PEP-CTERM/EpsH1 system associated)